MAYKKATVVGAGAMGSGIAQVLAAASVEVVLMDIKTEFVEGGLKRIASRFASDVKKGKMTDEEKDQTMSRIKGSISHKDASDSDLVLEAVIEDKKVKGELFQSLNKVCSPAAVFATNTSTLSVTDLGALSGRPARFIGLHFFNPVPAMRLVEVVSGLDTDKEVLWHAMDAMKGIKKMPIIVQDCPGFLVNRILLAYVGEAVLCAEEGISPDEIDGAARKEGFPMGPLELSDMVGWDVSLHTLPVLNSAYGERFPFPTLVQKLNDAGRLGMKTGKGVYTNGQIDDGFRRIVSVSFAERPSAKSELLRAEGATGYPLAGVPVIDRLILRQVNEAIYCLQEGVATPEEIDRAMVLGTGFPNHTGIGGPLHWADEKGLDNVLGSLEELARNEGARFWPHHLLKTYVAAGRLGRKTKNGFFTY